MSVPLSVKQYLHIISPYILVIVILSVFYYPALTESYLFSDDHILFSYSLQGQLHPLDNFYLRDGRPLTGLLLYLFVEQFDTISGFRLLRGISLLGTMILGVTLLREFIKHGLSAWAGILVSLSLLTYSGFAIYVGWASCFAYPFSALLAVVAGLLLTRNNFGKWNRFVYSSLAVCFLVGSLCIYQITTTWIVVPLLLHLSKNEKRESYLTRAGFKFLTLPFLRATIACLIAGLLYFVFIKVLKSVAATDYSILGSRSFFSFPSYIHFSEWAQLFPSMFSSWTDLFNSAYALVLSLLFLGCLATATVFELLERERES
jgi:hypothetical protein